MGPQWKNVKRTPPHEPSCPQREDGVSEVLSRPGISARPSPRRPREAACAVHSGSLALFIVPRGMAKPAHTWTKGEKTKSSRHTHTRELRFWKFEEEGGATETRRRDSSLCMV